MKISFPLNVLRRGVLSAIFVLATGAVSLQAQPAPVYVPPTTASSASGPSLASMNEDLQSLMREVGQLRLQVSALQQDNENLRKQVITQTDVNTAVQNAASKSRDETSKAIDQAVTKATTDLRKEIVGVVTKQIEALARDTNDQFAKLAAAMGKAPPVSHNVTAVDPNKAPPQDTGEGTAYIVKSGDSISKIAAHFRVPIGDILKANNLTPADANKIREGQNLFIPLKNAAPAPPAATK